MQRTCTSALRSCLGGSGELSKHYQHLWPLVADRVKPGTPLRLSIAAVRAFPDGTITLSDLRREAARGRLIERIAGKEVAVEQVVVVVEEAHGLANCWPSPAN